MTLHDFESEHSDTPDRIAKIIHTTDIERKVYTEIYYDHTDVCGPIQFLGFSRSNTREYAGRLTREQLTLLSR